MLQQLPGHCCLAVLLRCQQLLGQCCLALLLRYWQSRRQKMRTEGTASAIEPQLLQQRGNPCQTPAAGATPARLPADQAGCITLSAVLPRLQADSACCKTNNDH